MDELTIAFAEKLKNETYHLIPTERKEYAGTL